MDKQKLNEYHDIFLEEMQVCAPEEVQTAYKAYRAAFNDYLSVVQEDLFKQAFQYGYDQGLKANSKEEVA